MWPVIDLIGYMCFDLIGCVNDMWPVTGSLVMCVSDMWAVIGCLYKCVSDMWQVRTIELGTF